MVGQCNGRTDSIAQAEESFLKSPPPQCGEPGSTWACDVPREALRTMISESFAGTSETNGEPVFTWLMERCVPKELLVEGEPFRKAFLNFLLAYPIAEIYAKKGMAFCNLSPNGDIMSSVMIREWSPAKETHWFTKLQNSIRFTMVTFKSIAAKKVPTFFTEKKYKPYSDLLTKQGDALKMVENQAKYGPPEKHWYVNIVATAPASQGQGVGSEMMRLVSKLADEQEMDCYLECGNETNMNFYKKFGYKLVKTEVIPDLKDGSHPLDDHLMVRKHTSN
jgi:ribosomal protein S18 acetylase RimI-like enzyme